MNKEERLLAFGKKIRDLRLAKGLTQADVASAIGKDQQAVQRVEVGKSNASFLFIEDIIGALDMKIEFIVVDGSENESNV